MRAFGDRDVAVTGLGLVTPIGFGVGPAWEALLAGRSGVRDLSGPDVPAGMRLGALVEPPFLRVQVPEALQGQVKFLNGSGEMAATAVAEALAEARLPDAGLPGDRRGLFLAQGDNDRSHCLDFRPAVVAAWEAAGRPAGAEALNRASLSQVKPWYLLETLMNNAFSVLSAWWDLRGANTSFSGFPPAGFAALEAAATTLRRGSADVAVAVGTARTAGPTVRREMHDLGLAARAPDAYAPLDRRRSGAAPGEGAAALVLEPLGAARRRGAPVRAVLAGTGSAQGRAAPGAFGPPAEALVRAAGQALREAGADAGDLLGLVVPGIGTVEGDRAALDAAARILGGASVPVAAWKGALGLAACGSDLMEAAFAVRAAATGVLPGTARFEAADPEFAGLRVSSAPAQGKGRAVLLLHGGLEGQAAAACLARPS